ncbi:MAG: DUF4268 domain-containing protein [Thermoplasmata archaeon]|nr:DUF4268 domain-containing protein [Thermoplasmata archaeon]
MKELGRISHCKIRDIWPNENEFSDWLFSEENIELLSETLGLGTIQTEIREDKVGGFRADIVGEEADTGRKVIIENQFEKSDHDHLGKIITYAAGKDASIIVWVVEDARSEHASAIEWLNNNMTDKGFFLVQIEVIRIGNSLPAPTFTIIEKPNEYIQSTKNETSPRRQMRYDYWSRFIDYTSTNKIFLKEFPGTDRRKPSGSHWMTMMKGCKGFDIPLNVYSKDATITAIGAQMWIDEDKELFKRFEEHKEDIEKDLGFKMEWNYKENKKASYCDIRKDVDESESLESMFDWMMEKAVRIKKVFNKYA